MRCTHKRRTEPFGKFLERITSEAHEQVGALGQRLLRAKELERKRGLHLGRRIKGFVQSRDKCETLERRASGVSSKD